MIFSIRRNAFLFIAKKPNTPKHKLGTLKKLFPCFYEPLKASYIFRRFMKSLLEVNVYKI